MEYLLLVPLLAVVFGAIFMYVSLRAIKREKAIHVASRKIPTKFLPVSRIKDLKIEDLADYEILTNEIIKTVEAGKTNYSSHEIQLHSRQFMSAATETYFGTKNKKTTIIMLLLVLPIGWIPFVCYFVFSAIRYQSVTKIEKIFTEYLSGKLTSTEILNNTIKNTNSSDELLKLFELKKQSIISEEEFLKLKNKIVS